MYGTSFYNPYMYGINSINTVGRAGLGKGLFSNLFKKFSFSGFLSGTSKTLNVINQAIPIYYQVKPMISNAKTMFKVMNAVKKDDNPKSTNNNEIKVNNQNNEQPTFFV